VSVSNTILPEGPPPFHPLANEYPLLEKGRLDELAESIKANGQREKIVRLDGLILDGRNRYLACRVAGVEPVYREYDGPADDDSLRAFIEDANEHRRHLSPDFLRERARQRAERVKAGRRKGKSTRQLAKEEKVSQTQILKDFKAAEASGEHPCSPETDAGDTPASPEPEGGKVTGRDGKKYRAKKSKAAPPPVGAKAEGDKPSLSLYDGGAPPAPPADPPRPTDAVGVAVPDKLAATFESRARYAEARALLTQLSKLVNEIASGPGGEHFSRELSLRKQDGKQVYRSEQLNDFREILSGCVPHSAVCPWCLRDNDGKPTKKCKACGGLGWLDARTWKQAPAEVRELAEKLAEGR
jgi:ParB-like chromosome segregation protein Spo0J